jgi:hypothetical protein
MVTASLRGALSDQLGLVGIRPYRALCRPGAKFFGIAGRFTKAAERGASEHEAS